MTKVQITLRRASSIIFVQFLRFLKNLSIANMKSQVEIPGKKLMTRAKIPATREKYPRPATIRLSPHSGVLSLVMVYHGLYFNMWIDWCYFHLSDQTV